MKKRLFFGFALFVGFALTIAWQFAAAELADLQDESNRSVQKRSSELAYSQSPDPLFI